MNVPVPSFHFLIENILLPTNNGGHSSLSHPVFSPFWVCAIFPFYKNSFLSSESPSRGFQSGVAGSQTRHFRKYNFWDKKFSSNTYSYTYVLCIYNLDKCNSLVSQLLRQYFFIHLPFGTYKFKTSRFNLTLLNPILFWDIVILIHADC